jgi:rubrerythrin
LRNANINSGAESLISFLIEKIGKLERQNMSTNGISVAGAIKMAIQLEKDGMKFFTEAATKTQSESGKRIFSTLAKEEAIHLETFQKMFDSIESIQDWQELVKNIPLERKVPIFEERESVDKAVKPAAGELDALRTAMDHERMSIDFFEREAAQTTDPVVKQVFEFVREQEIFHYDLLQAEYDSVAGTGFWFDVPEFRMDGKF